MRHTTGGREVFSRGVLPRRPRDVPSRSALLHPPLDEAGGRVPLPEQLPLFVSAGFVSGEALLKVWRVATKRFGVSALGEVTLRRKGLPGGEMDSEASVVLSLGDLQREQQASGVSRKVVI